MKKRVAKRTTRRAVARGTTRRPNPRYRVILDGYDWASIPAFNKAEAVKRAKEIYPDKKGKWTAELVDEEMYRGMRGGAAYEAKIRLERKKARAAERAAAPPSRTRARRNGTHIHADMIDHLDVAKVHNPALSYEDSRAIYAAENDEGEGFTIGQESDDIAEAATLAGWSVIDRYSASLLLAVDSAGNHFLVGGDAAGRMPWVVKVEQEEMRRTNPDPLYSESELKMMHWMQDNRNNYSNRSALAIAALDKFQPHEYSEHIAWDLAGYLFTGPDGLALETEPRRKFITK